MALLFLKETLTRFSLLNALGVGCSTVKEYKKTFILQKNRFKGTVCLKLVSLLSKLYFSDI